MIYFTTYLAAFPVLPKRFLTTGSEDAVYRRLLLLLPTTLFTSSRKQNILSNVRSTFFGCSFYEINK